MREFDSREWKIGKGIEVFPITARHQVDIWVSCPKPVQVRALPEGKSRDPVVLRSGTEFRFRAPLYGFVEVQIVGTGDTAFGMAVRHSPRQNGEPLSDERPPVIHLGEPSNLVAKMRQMARAHHQRNRLPVLEPEDGDFFNRYEIGDDDEVLFEEEAYEKRVQEKKDAAKKKAEAEARKEAEAKAAPNTGTGQGGEAQPSEKGGEPPANKDAAE